MWKRIEKTLFKIIPVYPTLQEKTFGIQQAHNKENLAITLRNWVTFSLRHHIMLEERRAYHFSYYSK